VTGEHGDGPRWVLPHYIIVPGQSSGRDRNST
jgi:hypothetical protein